MAPERRISQVRCLERDSLTALRRAQVRNASASLCGGWLLRGKVCWLFAFHLALGDGDSDT